MDFWQRHQAGGKIENPQPTLANLDLLFIFIQTCATFETTSGKGGILGPNLGPNLSPNKS